MTNPKHFPQLVRGAALGALLTLTHAALAASPVIAGASPNSASGQLTITGAGFLPAGNAPAVRLDTLALTVLPGYTDTQIVATLPAGIAPGTYLLSVSASGGGTGTFDVTIAPRFLPFNGTVAAPSSAGFAVTNSAGPGIDAFGVGGNGVIALGGASGGNGVAGVSAIGGGGFLFSVANGGAGVSAQGAGGNAQGGDGVDAVGGMGGMAHGNNSGNGVSATGANSTNPDGFSGNGVYAVGGNGSWGGAGVYAFGGRGFGCDFSGVGGAPIPPWWDTTSNSCPGPAVYGEGGGAGTGANGIGGFFVGGMGSLGLPGGDGVDAFGSGGEGIYATPFCNIPVSCNNFAAQFDGDVFVYGNVSKSGGSFQLDHPLDPANQYLYHSFAESPDMKNIYDGTLTTDGAGHATVTLPDWFEALNRDFRYHLTAIGQPAHAWIASKISHNTFTIRTDKPHVEVSWLVTGVRQDAWANAHRIPVEVEKDKADQGHYIHPELFGHPDEPGIAQLHHPLPKRVQDRLSRQQH